MRADREPEDSSQHRRYHPARGTQGSGPGHTVNPGAGGIPTKRRAGMRFGAEKILAPWRVVGRTGTLHLPRRFDEDLISRPAVVADFLEIQPLLDSSSIHRYQNPRVHRQGLPVPNQEQTTRFIPLYAPNPPVCANFISKWTIPRLLRKTLVGPFTANGSKLN